RPRLFRLTSDKAIINRMGFNNYGVDHLVANIKKSRYRGIVGVNIGKNADTLINQSVNDYLLCMKKVYQYAHYITINISSPNTKQLRELQNRQELESLINAVKNEQRSLEAEYKKYVPVVIKIAPDLESGQISEMASLFLQFEVDGVIATNTTVSRSGLIDARLAEQVGGLSGAPLKERSTDVLRALVDALGGKIPVIASGGVMNAQDVVDKLDAGASLVQLYSGLVYTGPTLIRESVDAVNRYESRS
ncbi:MAG: dihydroorotate dehydrogenase (quinone), partial [Gammaproteobacteria bacterium]|nr:dihydroorotate dehydrogenase (quinone) [Gammaproteobacteria bacterium]